MTVRRDDFISFASTLRALRSRAPVVFERRPRPFMFGASNYGEICEGRNRADGDRWDVFTPGCTARMRTGVRYRCRDVLGYVRMSNGNHKIAIRLFTPHFDSSCCDADGHRYARQYHKKTGIQCKYVPLPRPRVAPHRRACPCGG